MKYPSTLLIATLVVVASFVSCVNGTAKKEAREQFVKDSIEKVRISDSIARAEFVKDSIARAEFVKDSINKAEIYAEIIKSNKPLFNESKDEFSNITWVRPKDAPKYTNRNGIYCYFQIVDGVASNFRFVYQYYNDDWLFIKNMIFNIDDDNVTVFPSMERDNADGMIWEWCDVGVVSFFENGINEEFIRKLSYAKKVKVKMNGDQYYDTRTLTDKQIKSIKNTYQYYKALGGKFI